jgi:hypothetical protein
MPAPEGIFPYAKQVFLVERYVNDLDGTARSAVAALGLMSMAMGKSSLMARCRSPLVAR